ncbi:MAG: nicotinate phosphoribosyltransferase [Nitrososphaerota archaeon]|jgi:nicotinate phosphoribosyltransferase|nr:nicotinate phosphoribosyltransferase [Nitrososphaerota archaeon]MDG6956484.1 nicotinate phosphoribosyltransferase [Nitrososphaerota archaeon]MDG6960320.1 nicotinate phosphoribosyltransferase [Nitrososphaerota archaeon]
MPRTDLDDRLFWLATEKEIRTAATTDAYFLHTKKVLRRNNIDTRVVMEIFARDVPYPDNWGVLTGVYEAAKLLEGLPVDVWAFDEGSVFVADRSTAIYEPLLTIEGRYSDFAEYETPLLGLLSSSTSISTRAAKFRQAAGSKLLLSFGTRRVHPALAPLVERACYVAGFDGVSNVLGARLLGLEPSGTMPHALVQILGSQEKAWRLFDETVPRSTPRVALVDTFWDEKAESIKALEVLGSKLWGVRLDTPASRRGDFTKIAEEVRWELDIRGGKDVKIIASGRLDEEAMGKLNPIVDGYGVGTAVAYPPVIDLSAKIVEVEIAAKREFRAKRGGLGGRKAVYRAAGFRDTVALEGSPRPRGSTPMLRQVLKGGKLVGSFQDIQTLRARIRGDLDQLRGATPALIWR